MHSKQEKTKNRTLNAFFPLSYANRKSDETLRLTTLCRYSLLLLRILDIVAETIADVTVTNPRPIQ